MLRNGASGCCGGARRRAARPAHGAASRAAATTRPSPMCGPPVCGGEHRACPARRQLAVAAGANAIERADRKSSYETRPAASCRSGSTSASQPSPSRSSPGEVVDVAPAHSSRIASRNSAAPSVPRLAGSLRWKTEATCGRVRVPDSTMAARTSESTFGSRRARRTAARGDAALGAGAAPARTSDMLRSAAVPSRRGGGGCIAVAALGSCRRGRRGRARPADAEARDHLVFVVRRLVVCARSRGSRGTAPSRRVRCSCRRRRCAREELDQPLKVAVRARAPGRARGKSSTATKPVRYTS